MFIISNKFGGEKKLFLNFINKFRNEFLNEKNCKILDSSTHLYISVEGCEDELAYEVESSPNYLE